MPPPRGCWTGRSRSSCWRRRLPSPATASSRAARTLLDEQAAAEERLRIARELHDVVAHNVSLMVIQAQALGATAHDPAVARRGAETIAELGRDAMSEMHRTLELMRADRGEDE